LIRAKHLSLEMILKQ